MNAAIYAWTGRLSAHITAARGNMVAMTKKNTPDSDRPSRRNSANTGEPTTAEKQKLPGWMPDFLVRAAAGASTKSANKRAADK
ncbi:hypothetical protein, partial [Xanthomonas hortorum]|uniref:hypothetical protein n=1 Tax=Xanthomonas hortorum TaxID=56454 RepID=UPI002FE3292D